jgi:hypothetical protein
VAARELAAAIAYRHTSRRPFTASVVPADALEKLRDAAAHERAALTVAGSAIRTVVVSLGRVAEDRLRHRGGYFAELSRWTRAVPGRRDGGPPTAFGPWDALERIPMRDFGVVHPQPSRHGEAFEGYPTIALLSTDGDGPPQWLQAGQALQRVPCTGETCSTVRPDGSPQRPTPATPRGFRSPPPRAEAGSAPRSAGPSLPAPRTKQASRNSPTGRTPCGVGSPWTIAIATALAGDGPWGAVIFLGGDRLRQRPRGCRFPLPDGSPHRPDCAIGWQWRRPATVRRIHAGSLRFVLAPPQCRASSRMYHACCLGPKSLAAPYPGLDNKNRATRHQVRLRCLRQPSRHRRGFRPHEIADNFEGSPGAAACRSGACRFDQLRSPAGLVDAVVPTSHRRRACSRRRPAGPDGADTISSPSLRVDPARLVTGATTTTTYSRKSGMSGHGPKGVPERDFGPEAGWAPERRGPEARPPGPRLGLQAWPSWTTATVHAEWRSTC